MADRTPEQLEAAVRAAAGSAAIPLAALAESRTRLAANGASPVASDVALALGVLKRANEEPSPGAGSVASIDEAVDVIGPGGVRAVVESLPLFDPLASHVDNAASPDRVRIHAVEVRDLAERLAQSVGHHDAALLRTAAVLHDVGKSVIAHVVPGYAPVLLNADVPEVRLRREREAIGIDHAEVGAQLLEACRVPRSIVAAVRDHHTPETATGPEAPLLAIADMLAHYRGGRRIDPARLVETAALVGLGRNDIGALLYDLGEPLTSATPASYPCPLSPGELQVVRGLARGMVYKEIAAELGVSPATVRNQIHRAYRKVGARDRAHIVLIAGDRGWL